MPGSVSALLGVLDLELGQLTATAFKCFKVVLRQSNQPFLLSSSEEIVNCALFILSSCVPKEDCRDGAQAVNVTIAGTASVQAT